MVLFYLQYFWFPFYQIECICIHMYITYLYVQYKLKEQLPFVFTIQEHALNFWWRLFLKLNTNSHICYGQYCRVDNQIAVVLLRCNGMFLHSRGRHCNRRLFCCCCCCFACSFIQSNYISFRLNDMFQVRAAQRKRAMNLLANPKAILKAPASPSKSKKKKQKNKRTCKSFMNFFMETTKICYRKQFWNENNFQSKHKLYVALV